MRFKVGDKVILKRMTLDEFDECDTGAGMLSSMLLHVGKVHTVSAIPKSGNPRLISPDGFDYFYSPNWLEPVRVFKGNK